MNTESSIKFMWDVTIDPDNNKLDLNNELLINGINEFIGARKVVLEQRAMFNEPFLGSLEIFEPFFNNN